MKGIKTICIGLLLMVLLLTQESQLSSYMNYPDFNQQPQGFGQDDVLDKVKYFGLEKIKAELKCRKCKKIRNKKSWDRLLEIVDYCSGQVSDLPVRDLETGVYYFHTDSDVKLNWFEASDFCSMYGMRLASIESAKENSILKMSVADYYKNSATGSTDTYFWTSLNSLGNAAKWTWSSTGMPADLLDWHTGEPSPGARCGNIRYQSQANIHWSARDCYANTGNFICELPQPCANVWPLFNKLTQDIIGPLDSLGSSSTCDDEDL